MGRVGIPFNVVVLLFFCLQLAHADLLRVSPEWLRSNLKTKNLVILDSRSKQEYAANHIEGAINFPDTLTYQQKSDGGRIVESDVMQQLLRERGVDYDKSIVIYDGGQIQDAARVFWALEVYGLNDVKILSHGFDDWERRHYPVSSAISKVAPSNYIVSVNHRRIASKFSTQLATKNPNQIIIDARDADSYRGKKSTAKRFGHIPTAVNVPLTQNLVDDNGVKSMGDFDRLKKIYSIFPKTGKIVTYCEMGRISSTTYFALRELGYDVSNYDASWHEWGNDLSLPIEK